MDEQMEIQTVYERQRSAVLLVDCHEEMFGSENAFQTVIQACFMYYDKMLSSSTGKNHLTILLAHNDSKKQVLIPSNINALEAYRTLHAMLRLSIEELNGKYANNREEPFTPHVLKAMKSIESYDMILYATVRSDPNIDEKDRYQALSNFTTMKIMKARFKVLSLTNAVDFSIFYDDVYQLLEQKMFHYYYQLRNLCEEIADSIHFKEHLMTTNLYPYADSKYPLRVEKYNVRSRSSVPSCVKIHKETLEVLQKQAQPLEEGEETKYSVPLAVDAGSNMQITTEQYSSLGKLDGIQMGITLVEARPQTSGSYSINGISSNFMEFLRATRATTEVFDEFWEAVKDLHLLCLCKPTRNGRVYNTELTPVQIRNERYFEMRFIPAITEMHISMGLDPYVNVEFPDVGSAKKPTLPQLDDLLEAFEIDDFEAILGDMTHPETAKVFEYAKQQLLGKDYTPKRVTSFTEVEWHKGTTEIINTICASIEGNSIKETGTKRRHK